MNVELVSAPDELDALAARAGRAARLAVDVESNGLHVFRPALCALQIAWEEGGGVVVAVVDTLATGVAALAPVFGPEGPIKVLHDLAFDARMLAEAGAPLRRVRDTSVTARLLGEARSGLAALLASELGVTIEKRFQQHDWSQRPLTDEQIVYLADDVRHLLALDDRLRARAEALDLLPEIEVECDYKLATAEAPPRDLRPAYVRIKGAATLDSVGRAALRRLVIARDEAAEAAGVPPFKVLGNDVLLELARARPASAGDLRAIRGATQGRAAGFAGAWLAAIEAGARDGDVPADEAALLSPPKPDRAVIARRRALEAKVSGWRRAEARLRGIDEQAVLPGHVAGDLVDLLLARGADDPALAPAIAAIPGIGARRIERYLPALLAIARRDAIALPSPGPEGAPGEPPA